MYLELLIQFFKILGKLILNTITLSHLVPRVAEDFNFQAFVLGNGAIMLL
jgi:hypothetical protein